MDVSAAITPTVDAPSAARPPRRHWTLLASAAVVAAGIVVGGAFVLRGGDDGPGPSADTAPLEGTVWQLVGEPGTKSSALLSVADGQLVADDDCRIVTGDANVHGDTLTVTDQVVRFKSCVDQYGPGYYEQGTEGARRHVHVHDHRPTPDHQQGRRITRLHTGVRHDPGAHGRLPDVHGDAVAARLGEGRERQIPSRSPATRRCSSARTGR